MPYVKKEDLKNMLLDAFGEGFWNAINEIIEIKAIIIRVLFTTPPKIWIEFLFFISPVFILWFISYRNYQRKFSHLPKSMRPSRGRFFESYLYGYQGTNDSNDFLKK